jgi:hypothetical protein
LECAAFASPHQLDSAYFGMSQVLVTVDRDLLVVAQPAMDLLEDVVDHFVIHAEV